MRFRKINCREALFRCVGWGCSRSESATKKISHATGREVEDDKKRCLLTPLSVVRSFKRKKGNKRCIYEATYKSRVAKQIYIYLHFLCLLIEKKNHIYTPVFFNSIELN